MSQAGDELFMTELTEDVATADATDADAAAAAGDNTTTGRP